MVFGGLIHHTGRLEILSKYKIRVHLDGSARSVILEAKLGDSIAISGVCLTVVAIGNDYLEFDLSDETLNKTTLSKPPQVEVHVEPALRFGDAIGGHLVSGHVHGVGSLISLDSQTGEMWVHLPAGAFPTMPTLKDSIAIDGVSLTVAEVDAQKHAIRIALIPHTIKLTLFKNLPRGAPVNLELNLETLKASSSSSSAYASATTTAAKKASDEPTVWQPPPVLHTQQAHGGTSPLLKSTTPSDTAVSGSGSADRTDAYWMRIAIGEAEKGRFTAPPNPWVGAVLVDQNNCLVQGGYHKRPGGAHAEREITAPMEGCTLYCTLEPCCHFGRTPPCVDHILASRPARVVVGTLDPDSRVSGKGVEALQKAGIPVTVGVAEEEVRYSLRSYLWHRSHNDTPYVVAKLALSQDNCFAYTTDSEVKRQWITGDYAREHGHGLRAGSQRIVVGKNTAGMDKPQLNVRYGYVIDRQPEAVVSTRSLDWYHSNDKNCIQILVEGGPELEDDLLRRGIIQEFVLYRSTKILGLNGIRWMPSFSSQNWVLVETKTFVDGDTMQRFIHRQSLGSPSRESIPRLPAGEAVPEGVDDYTTCRMDDIETALDALRRGSMIIVMDDETRENEGDLMMLADRMNLRNMKLLLANTTGIVCATMTADRAQQLDLPLMVPQNMNRDKHRTKFTVSVDAYTGVTTGVSAADRMKTLSMLAASSTKPTDLARPGHIFPLVAVAGGLLERRGHTEAGVELARMAGMADPVMVICELYDSGTGRMMSRSQCAQLGFPIITIDTIKDAVLGPVWADLFLADGEAFTTLDLGLANAGKWQVLSWGSRGEERVIRWLPQQGSSTASNGSNTVLLQFVTLPGNSPIEAQQALLASKALQEAMNSSMKASLNGKFKEVLVIFRRAKPNSVGADEPTSSTGTLVQVDGRTLAVGSYPLVGNKERQPVTIATAFIDATVRTLQNLGLTPASVNVEVLPNLSANGIPTSEHSAPQTLLRHPVYAPPPAPHESTSSSPLSPTEKCAASSSTTTEVAPGIILKKVAPKPWVLSQEEKSILSKVKVCFVQAEWHRQFSDPLVQCIQTELSEHFCVANFVTEFAPGSFELPRIVQHLSRVDPTITVFIAIGILIKGETDHYDLVAKEATANIARIQLTDNIWAVNCILACHDLQQVAERCLPESEKCAGPHMAHATARLGLLAARKK